KEFVGDTLVKTIRDKDPIIDGLFLDNLDVYYHVQDTKKYRSMKEDVFDALVSILETYQSAGLPVLIVHYHRKTDHPERKIFGSRSLSPENFFLTRAFSYGIIQNAA
ncbi:MAG: hypothetical protein II680_09820, partial [Clostridia bacterium]|nr:hypothetical protein [Clostridia bacterium]